MANRKDKGNHGKKRREPHVKEKVLPAEEIGESRMKGFRDSGVFCAIGYELVMKGLPVTLANCVGNLFPTKGVCRECGVCEKYSKNFKQADDWVVIKGIFLYPQAPVDYDKKMVAA